MARSDALIRLYHRLIAQRDELRRLMGRELASTNVGDASKGDSCDVANDDAERELNSQLAQLESRELAKIEQAIEAIRAGTYGRCEGCKKQIPIARLRALPYTSLCISCQRRQEERGGTAGDGEADWEAAHDYQVRQQDRELTLRDLDLGVTG